MDLTPEPDLNILFVEFVLARQMNRDFSKKKKKKERRKNHLKYSKSAFGKSYLGVLLPLRRFECPLLTSAFFTLSRINVIYYISSDNLLSFTHGQ